MTAPLTTPIDPFKLAADPITSRKHVPDALALLRNEVETALQTAPDLVVLAATSDGNGASRVGLEDAGGLYTATQVEAALAEVMAKANLALPTAKIQTGSLTLVAGAKTLAAGITITAQSKVFLQMSAAGAGALGAAYTVDGLVVGAPGTGAFTVTAVDAAGAPVATDISVHSFLIVG